MPEDVLERGMRDCGNNAVEKSADSYDVIDDDDDGDNEVDGDDIYDEVEDDKDVSHSPFDWCCVSNGPSSYISSETKNFLIPLP